MVWWPNSPIHMKNGDLLSCLRNLLVKTCCYQEAVGKLVLPQAVEHCVVSFSIPSLSWFICFLLLFPSFPFSSVLFLWAVSRVVVKERDRLLLWPERAELFLWGGGGCVEAPTLASQTDRHAAICLPFFVPLTEWQQRCVHVCVCALCCSFQKDRQRYKDHLTSIERDGRESQEATRLVAFSDMAAGVDISFMEGGISVTSPSHANHVSS